MEFLVLFGLLLPFLCASSWSDHSIAMMADFSPRLQKGGLLTAYQSEFMATHYSYLSVEKCLGDTELVDGILFQKSVETFYQVAKDFSAYNTGNNGAKVLFYWNAKVAYCDCYKETLPFLKDESMWFHDDDGNVMLPFSWDTRPFFDMSQQRTRQFWIDTVISIIRNGLNEGIKIDGVFIDGGCALFDRSLVSQAREDAFNAGLVTAVKDLKAALIDLEPDLYLLVNGIHFYTESTHCTEMGKHADGMMVEHFGSYEMLDTKNEYPYTYMNVAKVMTLVDITKQLLNDPDSPTDIHVKAWIGPETTPILANGPSWMPGYTSPNGLEFPTNHAEIAIAAQELLTYPLAIYLCALYDENVYFSYAWRWLISDGYVPCPDDTDSCSSPKEWFPEFTNRLGKVTSPVASFWNGYKCRRSFEHATVYVDIADETSAQIKWGESKFDWERPPPFSGLPELEPLSRMEYEIEDGIRWIKAVDCKESANAGSGTTTYMDGFIAPGAQSANIAGVAHYAQYAISVKFVPGYAENTLHHKYETKAKVCGNVVYNLNNGFELSLTTDETTNKIIGDADLTQWEGTDEALSRLKNTCRREGQTPRSLTTNALWYQACGNGNGMHFWHNTCMWDYGDDHKQDIELWLGFDVDFAAYCHKSNGKYVYGETLAPTAPTTPTMKPTAFPTRTRKPTPQPSASPTLKPTMPTTARPTSTATKTNALAPLESAPYVIENGVRWIKALECTENIMAGKGVMTYENVFNDGSGVANFAQYAIAVKLVPGRAEVANKKKYEVEAKVCSEPVYALNNGFELTYVLDHGTNAILDNADLTQWIGSDEAKGRLKTTCKIGAPRTIQSGFWYASCGNGGGIHMWSRTCQWNYGDDEEQDIEVWLGFDLELSGYCGDDTGRYVYGQETTTTTSRPPTTTTKAPTTQPPTTAKPTTKAPTTPDPTQRPTTAKPTTANPTTSDPTQRPTTADPTTANPTTSEPTSKPTKKKKQQQTPSQQPKGKEGKGSNGDSSDGGKKGGKGKKKVDESGGTCVGVEGASDKDRKKCARNKDASSCSSAKGGKCEWTIEYHGDEFMVQNVDIGMENSSYTHIAFVLSGLMLLLCAAMIGYIKYVWNSKSKAINDESEPLLP